MWTFASGLNAPGEITGYFRAGLAPGVTIWRLNRPRNGPPQWGFGCANWPDDPGWRQAQSSVCLWALGQVLKAGSPVFVDSGALSERAPDAPALGPRELDVVMGVIEGLASSPNIDGSQIWAVLPDVVGDQEGTLHRLRLYRSVIRRLALDYGVRCVVVLHKGRRSQAAFASQVAEMLGLEDLVLGFPVVGRRTRPEEIVATYRALEWKPEGLHLLGISPRSRDWGAYAEALSRLPSDLVLSSDAVMHRSWALLRRGKKSIRDVGELTYQYDEVYHLLWTHYARSRLARERDRVDDEGRAVETFHDPWLRSHGFYFAAEMVNPSQWLSKRGRAEIWRRALAEGMDPVSLYPAVLEVPRNTAVEGSWQDHFKLAWMTDPSSAMRAWIGPEQENREAALWLIRQLEEQYVRDFDRHIAAMKKDQGIRRWFTERFPDRLLWPDEIDPVEPYCFTAGVGQLRLF